MDSKVWVFELRDNKTVNKQSGSLTFPRPGDSSLYIITNEKSKCHLLQKSVNQKSVEKKSEEKKMKEIFQYGGSTKLFSVTDGTENNWEVRLLLSPSEVNRLSSGFNLTGYLNTCLVSAESHEGYKDLLRRGHKDTAEKICQMIAPFFCLPEDHMVSNCCTQLKGMMIKKIKESCKDLGVKETVMVVGGLVALMAAELAASFVASNTFDYTGEKTEIGEDLKEKIDQMVKAFNIQAELLVVSHRGKSVFIIFRNPCSDNWASGGRKQIQSGETFEFGLSHKVFSISGSQSEIQLLQSLQESYDMIAVFHIAAFAEHLLMTQKWRKTLDVLLKDDQNKEKNKETIHKLSQFAANFFCSEKCKVESFLKCFRWEVRKTLSEVKKLQVGGEAISVFGLLVAIMAALKAKAIADNRINEMPPSSDGDEELPTAPKGQLSKVGPDSKGDLPKSQDVVHPQPETIGANFKGSDDIVNEEAATGNKGGRSGGLGDGLGGENVDLTKKAKSENNEMGFSRTSGVGAPETITSSPNPDDIPHSCPIEKHLNEQLDSNNDNLVISSDIKTSEPLSSPVDGLSVAEPQSAEKGQELQGVPEITSTVGTLNTCKDDRQDQDEVNIKDPGLSLGNMPSKTFVGHVHDPYSGSGTTYDEETIDNTTPDVPTPTLDSFYKDTENTGHQETPILDLSGEESLTLKSQKDPSTPILQDTIDDTTPDVPTPTLDPSYKDTENTGHQETPILNISGKESLTLNSQKDPSTPISQDTIDDTTPDVPTPTLDSSYKYTENTGHQETPILNISGKESLTLKSQKDPSTPISQERKELDIDQLGQRLDHLSDVDEGGKDTSNRSVAQSSPFPMPLIILLAALVIVLLLILPSQWKYFLFTVLALMLGVYLFLGQ
ncbi:uncharacterized protein [Aquarana catesbeiana]|uniref:uncharacterized protein n=1 Tax=Aquarana catesbeiana TaxID=8400 RepID=UPI003CC99BA0